MQKNSSPNKRLGWDGRTGGKACQPGNWEISGERRAAGEDREVLEVEKFQKFYVKSVEYQGNLRGLFRNEWKKQRARR